MKGRLIHPPAPEKPCVSSPRCHAWWGWGDLSSRGQNPNSEPELQEKYAIQSDVVSWERPGWWWWLDAHNPLPPPILTGVFPRQGGSGVWSGCSIPQKGISHMVPHDPVWTGRMDNSYHLLGKKSNFLVPGMKGGENCSEP